MNPQTTATPTRSRPMPVREAFGDAEYAALIEAANWYRGRKEDPAYNGKYEKLFCDEFAAFQGGGYADAVATGTSSVFVALAALDLPKGSDVLISPVTDSGPLNAIILMGYRPVVVDSYPDSYNISAREFESAITPNSSCLLAVHAAGEPLAMGPIMEVARRHGIAVLEDCSQAPGAKWQGQRVGTFGDVAAFSTMYRKSLMSGSSGGMVFTRSDAVFRMVQAAADRGKQIWRNDLNQNDPSNALFPALNHNTDEFSCAIGRASLSRLEETIRARTEFCTMLADWIAENSRFLTPPRIASGYSPFYLPIRTKVDRLPVPKNEFAMAIANEGIPLLTEYGCIITDWPWARAYLPQGNDTPQARRFRKESFNLFVNENYGAEEFRDIINAIKKVESRYA